MRADSCSDLSSSLLGRCLLLKLLWSLRRLTVLVWSDYCCLLDDFICFHPWHPLLQHFYSNYYLNYSSWLCALHFTKQRSVIFTGVFSLRECDKRRNFWLKQPGFHSDLHGLACRAWSCIRADGRKSHFLSEPSDTRPHWDTPARSNYSNTALAYRQASPANWIRFDADFAGDAPSNTNFPPSTSLVDSRCRSREVPPKRQLAKVKHTCWYR